MVEAAIQGVFDHLDHDWRRKRRRWRSDDRALLGLIRTGRNAGILETDGRGIHPDTGVPPGGGVAPVCANVEWHSALERWGGPGVKPHGQGEAWISRDADAGGGACRFRREADGCDQVLPKRLAKFTLEVSPAKTRLLRCRRVHPGMTRRCTCLGVEFVWTADRPGGPRVTRRTARKTRPRAGKRITAGIQATRHLPGHAFFNGLKARLRGHDRDSGVHGNSSALSRFVDWAMKGAVKWRHRRGGKRRSCSWGRFTQRLAANHLERPRMSEERRRRVVA